jgi:soluble lytic murein transglycosylase-like protein
MRTEIPLEHPWDDFFKAAAATFLPMLDWRWLKAQGFQESRFDANARSPVGAVGPMQFMPDTWSIDVLGSPTLRFPKNAQATDPVYAIPAAAWYDRQQWNRWISPGRSPIDRIRLMLASYNAGFGHILEAQAKAHGALEAGAILSQLFQITGSANAKQTRDYVERIEGYAADLGVT